MLCSFDKYICLVVLMLRPELRDIRAGNQQVDFFCSPSVNLPKSAVASVGINPVVSAYLAGIERPAFDGRVSPLRDNG